MSSPKIHNAVAVHGCVAPLLESRLLLLHLKVGRRKKTKSVRMDLFQCLFTVTKIFLDTNPMLFSNSSVGAGKASQRGALINLNFFGIID